MCVKIEAVTICRTCSDVLEGPRYYWDACPEIERTLRQYGHCRARVTNVVMPKKRECTRCRRRRESREQREREREWADEYRNGGNYTW